MKLRQRAFAWILFGLVALPLCAQEPLPVRLLSSYLSDPQGVTLEFAWRFAPGDGPGREAPEAADRDWIPIKPALVAGGLPPDGWPGVGWFRRHLLVEPPAQRRTIAVRFEAPGVADVFLDGRLILTSGRASAPPEIPADRRDACLISLPGYRHVLAVRYAYPVGSPRPGRGIGFRLTLADPAVAPASQIPQPLTTAFRGAVVALPLFLALLHAILFALNPRSRENLFYAVQMGAFTLIVLSNADLLATDASRQTLDSLARGAVVAAILFGLLTYYAVRTDPFPRTWRVFTGAALLLLPLVYFLSSLHELLTDGFFFAVLLEVSRLEWSRRTVKRPGARFFLASFAVFVLTIVLQILVNLGLLASVAGVRGVYLFGILASGVGMSLYLAQSLGRSRLLEAEHARKTAELARARELQLSMLPRDMPALPGLQVAAATHTAAEVGGDYYDVRRTVNGELLVAFGDATGHGLASGVVVTAAKALFLSLPADGPVAELLSTSDRVLRGMRLRGLRMCLTLARISPREAAISSAAMPPVLVHRSATGVIEELGLGGLPLGTRLAAHYEERRSGLSSGDTLLFASDGFPELLDPDGRELGYGGAAEVFRQAARAVSALEVVERLGKATAEFRGARPQDDDITFVVVRVLST